MNTVRIVYEKMKLALGESEKEGLLRIQKAIEEKYKIKTILIPKNLSLEAAIALKKSQSDVEPLAVLIQQDETIEIQLPI